MFGFFGVGWCLFLGFGFFLNSSFFVILDVFVFQEWYVVSPLRQKSIGISSFSEA